MSGKNDRKVRKAVNQLKQERKDTANDLVIELMNSPFKYRFRFAMALIFHRKGK